MDISPPQLWRYNPDAHQAQGLRLDPSLGLFPVEFGSHGSCGVALAPCSASCWLLLFQFPWTELSQHFDPSPDFHQ